MSFFAPALAANALHSGHSFRRWDDPHLRSPGTEPASKGASESLGVPGRTRHRMEESKKFPGSSRGGILEF